MSWIASLSLAMAGFVIQRGEHPEESHVIRDPSLTLRMTVNLRSLSYAYRFTHPH